MWIKFMYKILKALRLKESGEKMGYNWKPCLQNKDCFIFFLFRVTDISIHLWIDLKKLKIIVRLIRHRLRFKIFKKAIVNGIKIYWETGLLLKKLFLENEGLGEGENMHS